MSMKLVAVLALSVLVFLSACSDKQKAPVPEVVYTVRSVVVGDMGSGGLRSYPGKVSASQKVDLAFEVAGKLNKFPVREGQEVEKGELLTSLDARDYENDVAEKQAKYDHAEITYHRFKDLVSSGTVSQSAYDEKVAMFKVAGANLSISKKALADTFLYAPFSGLIARRYVENFQYIQPKQRILSLQDVKDLEIIINVPEQDVVRAGDIQRISGKVGEKDVVGKASFASLPGRDFSVYIKEFKTEADPKTQTYRVTLLMPSPDDKRVLPGMTATVKIKFSSKTAKQYSIPIQAVSVGEKGDHFVWVIDQSTMRVKKKVVKVGAMGGDNISVLQGLKAGDRIVTAGVAYLADNMKVRIITGKIGS